MFFWFYCCQILRITHFCWTLQVHAAASAPRSRKWKWNQHRVESAFKHSFMHYESGRRDLHHLFCSHSFLLLRMISRVKSSVKTTLFKHFAKQFLGPAEVIVFLSLVGVASCASALGTQRNEGTFLWPRMRHHAVGVECLLPQVVDLRGQKLWRTTWPLFQRQLPQHGRFYVCSHHCLQVIEVLAASYRYPALKGEHCIITWSYLSSNALYLDINWLYGWGKEGFFDGLMLARWWYSVHSRVAKDHVGGTADVDLEIKALRIVDKVRKPRRFAQHVTGGGGIPVNQ